MKKVLGLLVLVLLSCSSLPVKTDCEKLQICLNSDAFLDFFGLKRRNFPDAVLYDASQLSLSCTEFNVHGAVIKRHDFKGEININNARINKDDKMILTKIVKSKNKIYFTFYSAGTNSVLVLRVDNNNHVTVNSSGQF